MNTASRTPVSTRGRPSVDSTLAAMDYATLPGTLKIAITGSGATGFGYSNRYWNATELPFSHAKYGGYLVTRLDGYTEADAKALVTRALKLAESGVVEWEGVVGCCSRFSAWATKLPSRRPSPGLRFYGSRLGVNTMPTCGMLTTCWRSGVLRMNWI